MTPKYVCILILKPCECYFCRSDKVKGLGESILGYPGGADITTRLIIRGRQEGESQRRWCDDGSRGWNVVLEHGGWGRKPRNERGLEQVANLMQLILPSFLQKDPPPLTS